MLAKLCVVIIASGCCASGLLTIRQSRIQAAHELTRSRLRILEHERQLQDVRARVAELTRPDALAESLQDPGRMHPVLEDDCPPTLEHAPFVLVPSAHERPESTR
ncbi:MAG: hypothetical protein AAGG07_02980 [Planctomycetota bacterium]